MRALTISQPFAYLIAAGIKPIENRNWTTAYRGELAIHAGRGEQYRDDYEAMRTEWWPGAKIPKWRDVPKGAIVAVATLADILPLAQVDGHAWAEGAFCWMLTDIRRLERPLYCRGRQGLWTVPEPIAELVNERLGKAVA